MMKRIPATCFLIFLTAGIMFGQGMSQNRIKIGLSSPLFGNVSAAYERRISPTIGLECTLGFEAGARGEHDLFPGTWTRFYTVVRDDQYRNSTLFPMGTPTYSWLNNDRPLPDVPAQVTTGYYFLEFSLRRHWHFGAFLPGTASTVLPAYYPYAPADDLPEAENPAPGPPGRRFSFFIQPGFSLTQHRYFSTQDLVIQLERWEHWKTEPAPHPPNLIITQQTITMYQQTRTMTPVEELRVGVVCNAGLVWQMDRHWALEARAGVAGFLRRPNIKQGFGYLDHSRFRWAVLATYCF